MKKIAALLTLCFCCSFTANAQWKMMVINGDTFYIEEPTKGDKCMEKNDVKGAIKEYRKEYKKNPERTAHNFACAFARNNQPDSAFKYLLFDVKNDTFNFGVFALSDPDLISLHSDQRWIVLRDSITTNFQKHRPGYIKNMPLAAKLWDMMAWDQAYYNDIFEAEKKLGRESPIVTALWQFKEFINQKNQRELDSIIKVNGWPKISDVGYRAAGAAFLIVQHSTLELQQQYLPTIKQLCLDSEAQWQSYALMYDRVQISQDKPQLYGSQVKYNETTKKNDFFPIEDEANVNKRRAEMGMSSLEEYGKYFDILYLPKK